MGTALVGVLFLFGCADQATQPTSPDGDLSAAFGEAGQELGPALAAQRAHSDRLMELRDVVGTGVGINDDGEPAVAVYLTRPGAAGVPERLDDVPVERVVTGLITAGADPTSRARPAPVGFSVGHPDITAGTYGARVTDGSSTFMLSNNHVLANSNDASIGDATLQPGPTDGGTDPDDRIAELADFEPIDFENDNVMDAAIAAPINADDILASTPTDDAYGAPSSTIWGDDGDGSFDDVTRLVETEVQKYGRTTGLTRGTVEEVNVTVEVCYEPVFPFGCNASADFVDQIGITPGDFSDGGDSGSLIVTGDSNVNPVGLLFAGSDTRTLANRIDHVLNRFDVSVDDGSGSDGGNGDDDGDTTAPTVSWINPTSGETVSGTVAIQLDASDEVDGGSELTVEWQVDNGTWNTATYDAGCDCYTDSWDTSTVGDGDHDLDARATDTSDNTSSETRITVNVDNSTDDGDDAASGIHVGDLNGASSSQGRTWTATVTVLVHDADHMAEEGSTVSFEYTGRDVSGSDSCTTGTEGTCSVEVSNIRKRTGTVDFTVTGVSDSDGDYTSDDNHDPDDDSDGSSITVSK